MKKFFKWFYLKFDSGALIANYIFYVFLCLMLLGSIFSIIINLVTNFPMVANIKWIFTLMLSILGIYLLKKNQFIEIFKFFLFLSIMFFFVIPSWFYGGGDNTITILYFLLILIETFMIFERSFFKWTFMMLTLIFSALLLVIGSFYPHLIQATQDQNVFLDTIAQICLIFMVAAISIAIFTQKYNQQQNLLKNLNKKLNHIASIDVLSEIYNRRKILEILENTLGQADVDTVFYVAMIDIDKFKTINDQHGHLAGDAVIKHVSQYIKESINNFGYVGRYGGDEFIIILIDSSVDQVKNIAHRLNYIPPINDIKITLSAGFIKGSSDLSSDDLIAKADDLLRDAKVAGRNLVKIDLLI